MPHSIHRGRSLVIVLFLLTLYVYRFFLIGRLELVPDEAYYWNWAKNLSLSYLEHPPMVAYIMALFTWIGGDSEFFVRVGGLLCTLVTHLFLYLLIRNLSGNDRGLPWELLFLFNLTLLFSGGCIVQTPDTPLLLFWTIALYGLTRVLAGRGKGGWYLAGAAFGLGLLSKYTMVLIVPCMLVFLLFSPTHRHWLARKEPYLATLLGGLLFSPVVFWNLQHEWASVAFQLAQGFSPVGKSGVSKLLEYAAGQLGVLTPLLFVAFVFYSLWGWFFARRTKSWPYFYLAMMSWPILVFFGLSTLLGEVAEPNWPAPAYVAGLPLMWIVYRRHFHGRRGHRRFAACAVGLALAVNLVVHSHLLKPVPLLPPDMDPTWQFHGWRELGVSIEEQIRAHPSEAGYFLVAEGPPTVAEAMFYTGNRYVGLDLTRPGRTASLRGVDELTGKNAVILSLDLSPRTLERAKAHFEEVTVLGRHRSYFRGEPFDRMGFYVLLGREFRGNGPPSM
jgi:4-amino-4-deoxy-L-arabinose transferase-like glycosyltransferase